ncbi:MAG: hypothetical protein ACE5FI_01435 [Anaerolineales bacterium]
MKDQFNQKTIWVCPNCTTGFHEAGKCPDCLVERVECEAGAPDDPCRKPLMAASGAIETRAPRWWLRNRLGWLAEAAEKLRDNQ